LSCGAAFAKVGQVDVGQLAAKDHRGLALHESTRRAR
jgi:hypothetical protein